MNNQSDNLKIYRQLSEGEFIVVGVDTAWGGVDYCAAQFLSVTNKDVPMVYHARELATEMTPRIFNTLVDINRITGVRPVVAYERNNGGIAEVERLQRLNKINQFQIYQQKNDVGTIRGMQQGVKLGWDTTSASRPVMLGDLKDAIDNFYLTIYDRATVNELLSFVIVQGASGSWKAQAEVGMHDDLIMSLAIAWQLYQTERIKTGNESAVVNQKPPNEKLKVPYVDEEGQLVGAELDKIVATAIKKTIQPRGNDWKYPRLRQ